MAKSKASNQKTNISTVKQAADSTVKAASSMKSKKESDLLYGKEFYMWMIGGFLLIVIGFFLMAGGKQAPTEWNVDEIYGVRRTIIAPIFILAGLVVEVYAIFKK